MLGSISPAVVIVIRPYYPRRNTIIFSFYSTATATAWLVVASLLVAVATCLCASSCVCVCCKRISGHSLRRRSLFIRSTATSFLYDYCLRSQFFITFVRWDEPASRTYIAFARSPLFNFEFRLEKNVCTLQRLCSCRLLSLSRLLAEMNGATAMATQ